MIIFPAIDIKDGKCVRLLRGDFNEVTVYSENPHEVAKRWEAEGGEFLHIVDLDGAREGFRKNSQVILKILESVKIPIQVGGGIRDMETVDFYLNSGVERVILGTAAVKDENFLKAAINKYGGRIVAGVDAKDNFVAIDGWENVSQINAVEFGKRLKSLGVSTIIYTDIKTDGTLKGPNLAAISEMVEKTKLNVIASGGVGKLEDIKNIKNCGAYGAIIGKALYTNNVPLKEAIEIAKN